MIYRGDVAHIGAATVALTVTLFGFAANAQPTDAQRSAIRSACRSDYMVNCSSVTPGGIEALQCLQRNESKLSGSCRSAVNAISTKATPEEAPATEAAKPPTTAKPETTPKPAVATAPTAPATSKTKKSTKSAPPSATAAAPATDPGPPPAPPPLPLASIPPRFEIAVIRSCRTETRTVCALPAGGGRILNCLAANQASVSPACAAALDRARAAAN